MRLIALNPNFLKVQKIVIFYPYLNKARYLTKNGQGQCLYFSYHNVIKIKVQRTKKHKYDGQGAKKLT